MSGQFPTKNFPIKPLPTLIYDKITNCVLHRHEGDAFVLVVCQDGYGKPGGSTMTVEFGDYVGFNSHHTAHYVRSNPSRFVTSEEP